MNNVPWSFSDFVQWLRKKSETFSRYGATLEFQVNEALTRVPKQFRRPRLLSGFLGLALMPQPNTGGSSGAEGLRQQPVRASVRLRIEYGQQLGELTVWDDGAANMMILDLASGDFVFERDGVSLLEASPSSELNEFFERMETGV